MRDSLRRHPLTYDGPVHNAIPEPDRSKDNSTLWKPNYSRAHYENMYFNRLDKFFKDQSSGKYRINGDVTEWVKVPFNEARYGREAPAAATSATTPGSCCVTAWPSGPRTGSTTA